MLRIIADAKRKLLNVFQPLLIRSLIRRRFDRAVRRDIKGLIGEKDFDFKSPAAGTVARATYTRSASVAGFAVADFSSHFNKTSRPRTTRGSFSDGEMDQRNV